MSGNQKTEEQPLKVGIVNIGLGNLTSVKNAFDSLGCITITIDNPEELKTIDRIILPGVGAFGDAMMRLNQGRWIKPLEELVFDEKKPFLGICLGMQVLATKGREYGEHAGLGWIPGVVEKLHESAITRIPHIGWNDVIYGKMGTMYEKMGDSGVFYFVHSNVLLPDNPQVITGITTHGDQFAASIQEKNIWATQYHPEKSQKLGLQVLNNFIKFEA